MIPVEQNANQLDEFELRILNWAAWARGRTITPVSCRSLESRYKAPPMYEYPELRVDINLLDAIEIEHALCAETFPKASMKVIVYYRVFPWMPLSQAIRVINKFKPIQYVTPRNIDEFYKKAENMLRNRLRKN